MSEPFHAITGSDVACQVFDRRIQFPLCLCFCDPLPGVNCSLYQATLRDGHWQDRKHPEIVSRIDLQGCRGNRSAGAMLDKVADFAPKSKRAFVRSLLILLWVFFLRGLSIIAQFASPEVRQAHG